ncbi:helix-hairpin-helix domain-containing protein [Nitrospira sp. Kam-Ns4a]
MAEHLNVEIAQRLREVARLLQEQGANRYRVQAYRHAAETIERLDRPVTAVLEAEGLDGLQALPGIGPSLARAIHDLVATGRLPMLDRLRGGADPVALLASVPGIGQALARKLHDDLGLDSLEALEAAAHDGRLALLAGIGEKRLAGIVDSLATRLGRLRPLARPGSSPGAPPGEPPVAELLDVDREYREKARAGWLRTIAPRRFNPSHEAWLPILHTQRGDRHYTVLFSNTARAHELGKTRDWVILYCDTGHGERQYTVITAQRNPWRGKRLVRGREAECAAYYRAQVRDDRRPAQPLPRKAENQ